VIQQERRARRAGTEHAGLLAVAREQFAQAFRREQVAAGLRMNLLKVASAAGRKGLVRLDVGKVDTVVHDPVTIRVGAGHDGGGVDPGDRGKGGVVLLEDDPFAAQRVEVGHEARIDVVGPEPVHHDQDNALSRGRCGDRLGRTEDKECSQKPGHQFRVTHGLVSHNQLRNFEVTRVNHERHEGKVRSRFAFYLASVPIRVIRGQEKLIS